MNKRNILMAIVGICGVASILMTRLIEGFSPTLQFLLIIPFYLIIIIFYRKTKLITLFCILTIISQFGYFMIFQFMNEYPMNSGLIRTFASLSFFFGIIGFFIAFGLVLQHKTYKFTEVTFLTFSIMNYVFFSYFVFYLQSYIVTIFGPFQVHIDKAFNVFYVIVIIVEVARVVLQVIMIHFLERNKIYEMRLNLKYKEEMRKSITD